MAQTAAPAPPSLLQAFDRQVEWCRNLAPFTSRVLQRSRDWLAGDAAAHAAFDALSNDPLAAAVALRWAGALHHLALRGLPPFAELWPPAGAVVAADLTDPALDAALDEAIRVAWHEHRGAVQAALALPPQTNEVLRSAMLLPGLLHIAARTGLPLVLLEIGASAGLNLWCDHYFHSHPGAWSWGDISSPLKLSSTWHGDRFTEAGADLRIARRAACDAHPIDLGVPDESLRLASFIWPEQPERLARLRAACHVASRCMAETRVRIVAQPAPWFLEGQLREPNAGHVTVVMHSVMWQYMSGEEQRAARALIEAAGERASANAPLAWLRMEPVQADPAMELRCRLWPGGADTRLAKVHPHGASIDWLAKTSTVGA